MRTHSHLAEPKASAQGTGPPRILGPSSPRPHLAAVVQLGQRDVRALELLPQPVALVLPAVHLQLGIVQGGLQLLAVGLQLFMLPLQSLVQGLPVVHLQLGVV